jgi:hypothetical protein
MAHELKSPAGKHITVRPGLHAEHRYLRECEARVVTDGGEDAAVGEILYLAGDSVRGNGVAELLITCPACGRLTSIDTGIMLAGADLSSFSMYTAA